MNKKFNNKRFHILLFLITEFIILIMSGCQSQSRSHYEQIVIEYSDKEILFPDSLLLVDSTFYYGSGADFKIISYVGSEGCTECKMGLEHWNRFMKRVNSVRGNRDVDMILIAEFRNPRQIDHFKEQDSSNYYLVNDSEKQFSHLNKLPNDTQIQTFLLDSDNKVILIGNPILNPKIADAYLSVFRENAMADSEDTPVYRHHFGRIHHGIRAKHLFELTNNSSDSLIIKDVISSCYCTTGVLSKSKISPNESYYFTVYVEDSTKGEFDRTIKIYPENNAPEITFVLTGEII